MTADHHTPHKEPAMRTKDAFATIARIIDNLQDHTIQQLDLVRKLMGDLYDIDQLSMASHDTQHHDMERALEALRDVLERAEHWNDVAQAAIDNPKL